MKLVASEPAIITKRSSHIPIFTNIVITHSKFRLRRIRGENSSKGRQQLQKTISQKNGAIGPKYRSWNVTNSYGSPAYQTMKDSVAYEYDIMIEVNSTTFARLSKCHSVTRFSSPSILRSGIMIVITIATPEKIAPATK